VVLFIQERTVSTEEGFKEDKEIKGEKSITMDIRSDDAKKPMMMWFLGMLLFSMVAESNAQLSENYYASTCPSVELIVKQAVTTKFKQTVTTAPATLRMFFHDCFVEVYVQTMDASFCRILEFYGVFWYLSIILVFFL